MKIAEYKQMMEYLTRPGFNGGGSVRNKTVLPKKKPEEEVKKRKIKNFEKAKPALENPKEVKEMIDKPKRGLVDEPGGYAGIEGQGYANPKKAEARKKIFIDAYGQEAFDNLSRGNKSKITTGDRNPLTVGQGPVGNPKTIYEPYRKEALKAFEKFKKSGTPFSAIDVAEEATKNMKGKKGAIKNINIEQLAQNLKRNFFTKEQMKFFDVSGSKLKRIKERQAPKRIIFEKMIKGDSNIESLIKATNLKKNEVENIIKNISNTDIPKAKKQLALGKDVQNVVLRDFKLKDFDTFRKSIANEPTLKIVNKKAITELVTDAYRNQPKKLERALKRVTSYFKVANQLSEAGLNLNLDHPLAKSIIGDMSKVEPEQLIRVSPLPKDINLGIKGQQFDRVYRNIINNLQVRNLPKEDRVKLLNQKKALETLSTDLKIPFGKMSQRGKIINFGAPEFLKQDLPKQIKSAINFKTRFKSALDSFEPQVLKERVMTAFDVTEDKANNLINQFKTVAKEKNPQKYFNILKGIFKKDAGSILKGLKADASDALNLVSETIFPTLQAAEVLPGEAQATPPKPKESMDFDLDMSLPTPTKKDITAETTAALTPLVMKYGPSVAKGLGRVFTRMGTPLFQAAYALADPASLMFSAPFTQQSNVPGGVYKKPKGIMQKFTRSANRFFLPPNIASPFIKGLSRASTFGFPVIKAGEELFKTRGRIRDFEQRMTPMEKNNPENFQMTAAGKAPKELVRKFMRELPQDAFEYTGAAGGGLLKQAGDRSGKPPEAGPTPQGLDFLMKRGR